MTETIPDDRRFKASYQFMRSQFTGDPTKWIDWGAGSTEGQTSEELVQDSSYYPDWLIAGLAGELECRLTSIFPDGAPAEQDLWDIWNRPRKYADESKLIAIQAETIYFEQLSRDLLDPESSEHGHARLELQARTAKSMKTARRMVNEAPVGDSIWSEFIGHARNAGDDRYHMEARCFDEAVWPKILGIAQDPSKLKAKLEIAVWDWVRAQLRLKPKDDRKPGALYRVPHEFNVKGRIAWESENRLIHKPSANEDSDGTNHDDALEAAVAHHDVEDMAISRDAMEEFLRLYVIEGNASAAGMFMWLLSLGISPRVKKREKPKADNAAKQDDQPQPSDQASAKQTKRQTEPKEIHDEDPTTQQLRNVRENNMEIAAWLNFWLADPQGFRNRFIWVLTDPSFGYGWDADLVEEVAVRAEDVLRRMKQPIDDKQVAQTRSLFSKRVRVLRDQRELKRRASQDLAKSQPDENETRQDQ
jgi:hypothetical protein